MKVVTEGKYFCGSKTLRIDPKEIGKGCCEGDRVGKGCCKGLEIIVKGLKGNPEDGVSVFLEYYEGKVQLHVWTDGNEDPKTIVLTYLVLV
jgi:hypothetical protein